MYQLKEDGETTKEQLLAAWLEEDVLLLVRLAVRARFAYLKGRHDEGAKWQKALEAQLGRVEHDLELADYALGAAGRDAREEAAWRACWQRLFNARPRQPLLPAYPPVDQTCPPRQPGQWVWVWSWQQQG